MKAIKDCQSTTYYLVPEELITSIPLPIGEALLKGEAKRRFEANRRKDLPPEVVVDAVTVNGKELYVNQPEMPLIMGYDYQSSEVVQKLQELTANGSVSGQVQVRIWGDVIEVNTYLLEGREKRVARFVKPPKR